MVLTNENGDDTALQDLLDLLTCHRSVFWLSFCWCQSCSYWFFHPQISDFNNTQMTSPYHPRLLWVPTLGKHMWLVMTRTKRMNLNVSLGTLVVIVWIKEVGIEVAAHAIDQTNLSQSHTYKMRTSWNWIVPVKFLRRSINSHTCHTTSQSLGPQLAASWPMRPICLGSCMGSTTLWHSNLASRTIQSLDGIIALMATSLALRSLRTWS